MNSCQIFYGILVILSYLLLIYISRSGPRRPFVRKVKRNNRIKCTVDKNINKLPVYIISSNYTNTNWLQFQERELSGRFKSLGLEYHRIDEVNISDVYKNKYKLNRVGIPITFNLKWPEFNEELGIVDENEKIQKLEDIRVTLSHIIAMWTAYDNNENIVIIGQDNINFKNFEIVANSRNENGWELVNNMVLSNINENEDMWVTFTSTTDVKNIYNNYNTNINNTNINTTNDTNINNNNNNNNNSINEIPLMIQLLSYSNYYSYRAQQIIDSSISNNNTTLYMMNKEGCLPKIPVEKTKTMSRTTGGIWNWGGYAYIINRKGIKKLLDRYLYPGNIYIQQNLYIDQDTHTLNTLNTLNNTHTHNYTDSNSNFLQKTNTNLDTNTNTQDIMSIAPIDTCHMSLLLRVSRGLLPYKYIINMSEYFESIGDIDESSSSVFTIDLGCYKEIKQKIFKFDTMLPDSIVGDGGECITTLVPLANSETHTHTHTQGDTVNDMDIEAMNLDIITASYVGAIYVFNL
eukprot:GHVR01109451.1.p1 GENE.GHVR01109451.1~~GHVR01109451.1.p1  ORF type:complete len:518 (+),score=132.84 GHVR01109451.1:127-1680(+)